MKNVTRRVFLGSAAAAATAMSLESKSARASQVSAARSHPLEDVGREKIKITDVKATPLSCEIPPDEQWYGGRSVCWKRDTVLVEVFTDQGVVGIGGVTMYAGPPKIKKYIEEVIKPAVVGQNPFDVELLTTGGITDRGERQGWAGVDNAMWDIIGKVKNVPVYKLLATDVEPNPRLRIYASAGLKYAWYDRPEDLVDEAVGWKEQGYTAFKFRGGTDWKYSNMTMPKYIRLMEKLRAAVGPDFDLMQESNMRWTLEECLELCPALEELKFLWFEEPFNGSQLC